jgi:hypothetical protein
MVTKRRSILREKASPAAELTFKCRSSIGRLSLTDQTSDQGDTVGQNIVTMVLRQSFDRLDAYMTAESVENDFEH